MSYSTEWEVVYKKDRMTDEVQVIYSNKMQSLFVFCNAKQTGIFFLEMPDFSKSNPNGMIRFDMEKAIEVRGVAGKGSYTIASSFNKKFIDGMINSSKMLLEIKDPNSDKYYEYDLKGFSETMSEDSCLTNSIVYAF